MPRIIFTSRYLKNANKTALSNYVKYLGTRETVEIYTPKNSFERATEPQRKLIKQLLETFPEGINSPEYAEFSANQSKENAKEFISETLEMYSDKPGGRDIFMKYLAERPGVERSGKHGLFSMTNEEIDLSDAMKTVSDHSGIIWTHVVSIKHEDAERLGFNDPLTWRNAVIANLPTIAAAHKIPIDKLKWYAAFHNTSHHPHIHLVVFSEDAELGYLTNQGIEKMRHAFADTIFHNEMAEVYTQQTKIRDELRRQSKEIFEKYFYELSENNSRNPQLEMLITQLWRQLKRTSGKKQYGYLQPKVKATVNQIVAELAKNPSINKMYAEWCELEKAKHSTYTDAEISLPSFEENKVFKPIKNAIIKAVDKIDFDFTEEINSAAIQNTALDLLKILGELISDSSWEPSCGIKTAHTDSKQRRQIKEKKQALGLKSEPKQTINY